MNELTDSTIEILNNILNNLKTKEYITDNDIPDLIEIYHVADNALKVYREKDDFYGLAYIYNILFHIYNTIYEKSLSPATKNKALKFAILWKDREHVERSAQKLRVDINIVSDKNIRIADGDYLVRPMSHLYFDFNIPLTADLIGSFKAFGGRGNDIEVIIIYKELYNIWLKHNNTFNFYYSGKRSADDFRIFLGSGDYLLIFSNRFSLISNKRVTTKIYLIEKNY